LDIWKENDDGTSRKPESQPNFLVDGSARSSQKLMNSIINTIVRTTGAIRREGSLFGRDDFNKGTFRYIYIPRITKVYIDICTYLEAAYLYVHMLKL
jgi:hypothetical protein